MISTSGQNIQMDLHRGRPMGMTDPGPNQVTLAPGTVVYFGFGYSDEGNAGEPCYQVGSVKSAPPNDTGILTAAAPLQAPFCGTFGEVAAVGAKGAFTGNGIAP